MLWVISIGVLFLMLAVAARISQPKRKPYGYRTTWDREHPKPKDVSVRPVANPEDILAAIAKHVDSVDLNIKFRNDSKNS